MLPEVIRVVLFLDRECEPGIGECGLLVDVTLDDISINRQSVRSLLYEKDCAILIHRPLPSERQLPGQFLLLSRLWMSPLGRLIGVADRQRHDVVRCK